MRKYQTIWEALKRHREVRIQSNMPVRRLRKGVQKEKYLDEAFRRKFPNALLDATANMEGTQMIVTFRLSLFEKLSEDDFEFECSTCRDTGIVNDMACPECTSKLFAGKLGGKHE